MQRAVSDPGRIQYVVTLYVEIRDETKAWKGGLTSARPACGDAKSINGEFDLPMVTATFMSKRLL